MTTEADILLEEWVRADNAVAGAEHYRGECEIRLQDAMKRNSQEEASAAGTRAIYRGSVEWDRDALLAVKEFLSPEEWDSFLTNPKPPERKPNLVKIKNLAKRGEPFRSIVESAQHDGTPTLRILRGQGDAE